MTPRVAIVSSGLGYVRRGIETWAASVAEGVHKSGGNVILFGSGPLPDARSPYVRVPCLRRDGWTRRWLSWDKSYLWEQVTFARNLRAHLQSNRFDIVHAADPNVAQQLIKHCKRAGLALIYQDGLLLGPQWYSKFEHVQLLAPAYADKAHRGCRIVPHFVDTKRFAPRQTQRDSITILAAGDFSIRGGKRLDWVIDEAAKCQGKPRLKLAGHAETEDLQRLRQRAALLADRIEFLPNQPHDKMPEVFRSADLFVHSATREPFGIVIIEAMGAGLPIIGHDYQVTKWIIGSGGMTLDMTRPGELASAIDKLCASQSERARLGREARARAISTFDKDVVLRLYHDWYQHLAQTGARP